MHNKIVSYGRLLFITIFLLLAASVSSEPLPTSVLGTWRYVDTDHPIEVSISSDGLMRDLTTETDVGTNPDIYLVKDNGLYYIAINGNTVAQLESFTVVPGEITFVYNGQLSKLIKVSE